MQFLCHAHKKAVETNPVAADKLWLEAISTGQAKAEEQNWYEASLYFGTAYDVAHIGLGDKHKIHKPETMMNRLIVASRNLCYSLCQQKQNAQAEAVMSKVHKRFLSLCLNKHLNRENRIIALDKIDYTLELLTSLLEEKQKTHLIKSINALTGILKKRARSQLYN